MTALLKPEPLSVEEYLAGELVAEVKHEYLGGEVHAMAGGTTRHSALATNVTVALGSALRGKPCRAFNSDLKVRIELPGQTRFYYPDSMVVCEPRNDSEQWQDRPVVIVEVLSETTRRIDLTEKREAYLAIPTLKALIFVEPDLAHADVYRRGPSGGFLREEYSGLDAIIPLPEIEASLPLADVYEGIEF
jgi:Uma2 family endonuclease